MPSTDFLGDAAKAINHVIALPPPLAFMSGALARSWKNGPDSDEAYNCLFAWLAL